MGHMCGVDDRGHGPLREPEPVTLMSWGFRGVNDPGIAVALHRKPDRLVIEIHAPMDLLNLKGFVQDAGPAAGESP